MKKKVLKSILILCSVCLTPLYADRKWLDESSCKTDFDENRTFLTFYGDSLGDFVDEPMYGVFGWESYLSFFKPGIEWDVQNFAVGSWTTLDVYNLLKDCADTDTKRNNFRTADNVAFEIGGNDYIQNSLLFAYAPWRANDITDRVAYNQEIIIRMLKRRNKRVLVMGNLPAIAKSPTPYLGNYPGYFQWFKHRIDGQILEEELLTEEQKEERDRNILRVILPGVQALVEFHGWLTNNVLTDDISSFGYREPKCGTWYHCWLKEHAANPLSHAASMLMYMGQPKLIQKAQTQNVEFLELYPFFIRHYDCRGWGQCWVANPDLYADLIHVNHYGYLLWSAHLSNKIEQLDWHNTLPNTNSTVPPSFDSDGDPDAPDETVEANWLDLAIIFCLFTGKCG